MTRRALYVVAVSDCTWPGVLGVHTSLVKAMAHLQSIKADRLRWYRVEWDQPGVDEPYAREHDPLWRAHEVRLARKSEPCSYPPEAETVTLVVLRVWR
jgi:hypothetical protein